MCVGIVGGGLAGVTLAAALAQKGIAFDLFERASAFEPVGAGIALMPPALAVADKLNLSERLYAASNPLPTFRWLTAKGKLLLDTSYPGLWQGRDVRGIHRPRLHEVLLWRVPPDATHLGADVTALRETEHQVEVRTADGTSRKFDLVVGADGVHSRVRSLMWSEGAPRFLGQNYWRAALRRGGLVDSYGIMLGADRSLGIVPLGNERTHFFAQQVSEEPVTDALDGRLERLRERFAHFGGFAVEALRSLETDAEVHFGHGYEVPPLTQASLHGRVILVGDADHATSPNLGIGGAMAMEDAWVLADELARAPLDAALSAFRKRRRPRIEWVQQRTLAWVQRARSKDPVRDPVAVYRADYAPLLVEP